MTKRAAIDVTLTRTDHVGHWTFILTLSRALVVFQTFIFLLYHGMQSPSPPLHPLTFFFLSKAVYYENGVGMKPQCLKWNVHIFCYLKGELIFRYLVYETVFTCACHHLVCQSNPKYARTKLGRCNAVWQRCIDLFLSGKHITWNNKGIEGRMGEKGGRSRWDVWISMSPTYCCRRLAGVGSTEYRGIEHLTAWHFVSVR